MTDKGTLGAFDFTFDAGLDFMDEAFGANESPDQSGLFLPNTEGRTEFLPPDPDRVPVVENMVQQDAPEYAQRPAEERTRELLGQMRPHRAILLGILDAARTPFPMDKVAEFIEEAHEQKFSVYTPSNLCTMLEVAGALKRVGADGSPYEVGEVRPDIAVIEGEEYWVPTYPPKVYWLATDAGLQMVDEDDPAKRIARLFERESDLLVLHKRILTLSSAGEGVSVVDLSVAVDDDPLISEPRRFYVQHFVEELERCGALTWSGSAWKTTEVGFRALEELADVVDDYQVPEGNADRASVPTETTGISW